MATTIEKLSLLFDEIESTPPEDASPEARDMFELVQIARGFGFDLRTLLLPASAAEADVIVDKLIALLLQLRGDDLAPFDLERVALEAGEDA